LTKAKEAAELAQILSDLPSRLHKAMDRAVLAAPDRPALIEGDIVWSYRELNEAVGGTAAALEALGVRPGDRMMIVSENCIALATLLMAASRIDAWAIVVNPRLSWRELDQIRDHSGARRIFFTGSISSEAALHAERYDATIQQLGPLTKVSISPLNDSAVVEPTEPDPAKQVGVLIYTSGTTGTPKGVMLTHENLLFSAKSTALFRRLDENDVVYVVLPISHIVGISLLIMTLMAGGVVRLVSKYDPAALAKAIAEQGVTVLNGVPATYQRLLEYKALNGLPKIERGTLRLISVAGAPLDVDLKSRTEQEFELPLLNGYGITECSPGIAGVRFDTPRGDHGVGTLLPGVEARIVSREGKIVKDGEVGELHVRGRNVMRGYYRSPEQTAKAIDAYGWFNTGDLARVEDNCLFIVGRTKEMIIRSGFNVYPAEIEAVLNAHDAVVQSAVVGRAVDGNEEVVAFVQLLQGAAISAADLMIYAREQLTSYKRPSEIIVLEVLPATSTGKILKHRLAESLRGT
jgi:acyl-CoA synthetase (AMP-forming)/AMP-acid ligase II